MSSWILDSLLVLILLLTIFIEWRRGFGRSLFDLGAVIIAFLVAKFYYVSLSSKITLFHEICANQAFGFAVLLIPSIALLLILSDLAYNSVLISTDIFERILGGLCGLAVGITLAHSLAFGIWLGDGLNEDRADLFNHSVVASELLTFKTYHHAVDELVLMGQVKSSSSALP